MSDDKLPPPPDDKVQELIGLYSDLIGAAARMQRVLESKGVRVNAYVVTRREGRAIVRREPKDRRRR